MDTQTKEKIVEDYIKNNLKLTEIFEKYHTSYKTVSKILDESGIDHSRKTRKKNIPNSKNRRILSCEEESLICKIYSETGRVADCQKELHCGQDVVKRCLQKYGLHRTQSEAIRQSPQNQRKYPVKDEYFDSESNRMAYILGFLAADGCVRKDTNEIKIGVSSVDKDFLELLRNEIGGQPIKTYVTQKGFSNSNFVFTSKHIKDKLAEYNIVPNKTFSFTFPQKLAKEYWIDFIRGYFDGDGSVSTAGKNAIRFQIGSATKDVLETIINFFYEEYNISKPSIMTRTTGKTPFYYFQYSSVPTRQIFDILYYNGCLCLPRKYEKYKSII